VSNKVTCFEQARTYHSPCWISEQIAVTETCVGERVCHIFQVYFELPK